MASAQQAWEGATGLTGSHESDSGARNPGAEESALAPRFSKKRETSHWSTCLKQPVHLQDLRGLLVWDSTLGSESAMSLSDGAH